jgi:hypothetical protein
MASFLNPTTFSQGTQRVLGTLRSANFNITTDQIIPILPAITAWYPTAIIVTNASASLTTAAGGIYTAASKGGGAIVLAATTYAALTGPTIIQTPTIQAAGLIRNTISSLYFSLTTPQGIAATADIYVVGIDLT